MDFRKYSRLPQEPEYWDSLANRIEAQSDDGRRWLRAASLIALVSAAAAAVVFAMTPSKPALTLTDPVAVLFAEAQ